ncbi:hypothetical protein [Arenibaculum pallidiluteum]|uniref:hypothetical protein n=1 Tax=Arenibaculum pallidiluteum TaxID=2812559 RepID=UPI001A958FA4|nr:hypothetical protein [Arenibaculum pallidiluteum]
MALRIETFSNTSGGSSFFKAAGHPVAAPLARDLVARLEAAGPVAIYDPYGFLASFTELYDLSRVRIAGIYVQDVEKVGAELLGTVAKPVTELPASGARAVLVATFDADRPTANAAHLIPPGAAVLTLDAMRLPAEMLSDRRNYLAGINWATNFVFFRDGAGRHTRLVTANYWAAYGGTGGQRLWCRLLDAEGATLAEWTDPLPGTNATVVVDSADVRARFGLPEFTGSLFVHVLGAAGHDIVKYALDTYGDAAEELSCTHDANAWPSDYYAGLPAPRDGERVLLWVQNSHPCPIPAGAIGLNLMGRDDSFVPYPQVVPPFGTVALDVGRLMPDARWPQQLEVVAGRHFVRPRYEVLAASGRTRIAHANVERTDTRPDPRLPRLAGLMGKGFILPAPVLPLDRFRTIALPTPMARSQEHLPIKALLFDATGRQVAEHRFGNLARRDSVALEVDDWMATAGASLPSGRGHMEIVYDWEAGEQGDGWLHAIFRYEQRHGGHGAETSFGSHIYNTVLTYRNEPQSYAGRPPGLTTRLFLRLGRNGHDAFCCLVYPNSTPWRPVSETDLILHGADGREVARRRVEIPASGSHLFQASATFSPEELAAAGPDAYVLIRDLTCRLFGYHGLMAGEAAFSLDHMFGF